MTRRSARRRPRGQTMVEFALMLPVFILMLVGIFDAGRAVFAYHTVSNAAHEGGRQAIVDQTRAHVEARAVQHAVALGIAPSDVTVDYRDPSDPETSDSCLTFDGEDAVGTQYIYECIAVVRVRYLYTAATPIIGNLIGPTWITGEARFPVAFNCVEGLLPPDKPQCPVGQ